MAISESDPQQKRFKKSYFIGQKYEVYDVLGEGGFGIVYLVYSHELKEVYALKTFRDEYIEDILTRERFRKEAQVWINLERHPYLVRAYLVDEVSNRLFIAMEHIASDEADMNTLAGYLRNRPPDLAQSLRWSIQFCYGMEHAYSKGVKAHRDIKPANIMIDQSKTVRITDFGLAGILPESSAAERGMVAGKNEKAASMQTVIGTSIGTPEYMSPEQFDDLSACDKRSDIYSFGIVLYQMASGGRLPFSADNPTYRWTALKHFHQETPIPKLSSPLYPILQTCLEKEPGKRYQSFKELRVVFEALLKSQTGEVIEKPETSEFKKWEWWEWGNRGNSLDRLGKQSEALYCYDNVLKQWPTHIEALLSKGKCLIRLERFAEAIQCFDKANRSHPHNALAWLNKGYCYGKMGRFVEALSCYDQALKIDAIDITALRNKGWTLAQIGRHDEAINCYERLLKIDANNIDVWFSKGFCLRVLRNIGDALACFDKVLKSDPQYINAWINKGKCLMAQRNMFEALGCYIRALDINKSIASVWYEKALCEDYLGQKLSAVSSYKVFISLSRSDDKDIGYANQRVRELVGG